MATKTNKQVIANVQAESRAMVAVEAQLHALCGEDNFAHGLEVLQRYPKFETRELSLFEDDMRDWGYVYGLAFALMMRDNPELPHEDAARLAFKPALAVYRRWSGEIENPAEQRERAIQILLRRFDEADRTSMPPQMHDAILDLSESARG